MNTWINLIKLYHAISATEGEDYIGVDMNITFTSGQNASGDNQQCFSITILNDDLLECNETFDVVISAVPDDNNVVNITEQVITVTVGEDPNDCKFEDFCLPYKIVTECLANMLICKYVSA